MNTFGRSESRSVRYEHRGITLDAPRDWTEESVLVLRAPGDKPQPNICVFRVSLSAPEETLETFAAKKVAEMATEVAGLEVEETRETVAAGVRAISLRLAWEELDGRLVQRHLFFKHGDSVYMVVGTASAAVASRMNPTFDSVVSSLKLPVAGGR